MHNETTAPAKTTLAIDGMSCGHCVQAVTQALATVPGIKVHSVAVGSAAIVAEDPRAVADVLSALNDAGYPARASTDPAPTQSRAPNSCCGGSTLPRPASGSKPAGGCCGGD